MKKPFIFGIGKAKSGSNSLANALSVLGYEVHHTGTKVFERNTQVRDTLRDNMYKKRNPLQGVEGMDAVLDYPVHMMWKQLDEAVTNAKFIMTYRDPYSSAMSWCRMVTSLKLREWEPVKISYREYAEIVIEHVDEVMAHFGRRKDFLVLDITDSDETKWKTLATFLDKPVPKGIPYPKSNDHASWYRKGNAARY